MHSSTHSLVGSLSAASLAVASPIFKRSLDLQASAKKYFGNDAPWYQDRVPYFECSVSDIQDVYYYRRRSSELTSETWEHVDTSPQVKSILDRDTAT